jgi:hypothetical protein
VTQWHRDIAAQRLVFPFFELEDSAVFRRPVGAEAGIAGAIVRGSGGSMFSGASNLVSRGLAGLRQAKKINEDYGLTNLARTYGGTTGSQLADAADMAMNTGSKIDSLYGNGKRHRSSGIM